MEFAEATAVDSITANEFTATLDPEWTVNGRPHGGYLLAVLGRAAVRAVPGHPHPLSASAVYVVSPETGPATITVEVLRQGRTASQVRTRLVQKDRTCVETLFTLGRLAEDTDERWVDAAPPAVAPPDQCRRSPIEHPNSGVRVAMLDMVEQRIDPASYTVSGDLWGWLGFADRTSFDPVSLLYVADSFPPATFTIGSVGWVPTLELTAYVRALPAPGPLRVRQRARLVAGTFVDQVCEAWDSRGRVVLQATQLAAVRLRDR
jgi:hypothetical protein